MKYEVQTINCEKLEIEADYYSVSEDRNVYFYKYTDKIVTEKFLFFSFVTKVDERVAVVRNPNYIIKKQ